jgi:hypothetical protein
MLSLCSITLIVVLLLGIHNNLATGLSQHTTSRRSLFRLCFATTTAAATTSFPVAEARAASDCFGDCLKNCKALAPNDSAYCRETCQDYCDQPDRTDGLSGSVSSTGGEVGILGGSFGTGTVVKGEDKPPTIKLPGLDFSSGAGKKLIGY